MRESADNRRPRWVYGVGQEPDPRFSLANERTLLAWLRTAAACAVTAVALAAARDLSASPWLPALASVAAVAGVVCAPSACLRWAAVERALRLGRPLPAPSLVLVGGALVTACALLGIALLLIP